MKSISGAFCRGFVLAAVIFVPPAAAADISFDGGSGGAAFADYARSAAAAIPPAAPAAAGAHVYDFRALYGSLGYPSPDYFGAPEEAVQDLESYISKEDAFYGEINGYLRYYPAPYEWYGTGPDDARAMVARIDTIFEHAPPLPGDLIMFRGLGLGYRQDKPFAIGEEFIDKGYVSTSLTYSVARHFALEMGDSGKPSRRALFVIYPSRAGEKAILIDQGEDEVMLGHGRKFRVMAQKDGVRKYDLYLVQLCAASCETALRGDAGDFWSNFTVQD